MPKKSHPYKPVSADGKADMSSGGCVEEDAIGSVCSNWVRSDDQSESTAAVGAGAGCSTGKSLAYAMSARSASLVILLWRVNREHMRMKESVPRRFGFGLCRTRLFRGWLVAFRLFSLSFLVVGHGGSRERRWRALHAHS